MKYNLLDQLAQYTGVHYVSDLKNKDNLRPYYTHIMNIEDDIYSLDDWRDMCEYVLKNSDNIITVEDAKKRIKEWLDEK